MALVRSLRGFVPVIGENTFLADTAAIIGDVTVGRDCSIWFGAVLRGDVNKITVGDRVNIQDGVVVHTLYQRSVTEIGDDVSIGHNANIHGARIESRCLIGMGVTVLDHAVVGTGSIVAANSLVLSRTVIEPGSVYAGQTGEGRDAGTGSGHHRTDRARLYDVRFVVQGVKARVSERWQKMPARLRSAYARREGGSARAASTFAGTVKTKRRP